MKAVSWIVFTAVLSAGVVLGMFVDKFGVGYWNTVEEWAQTGDFFGGILNPIFAFLSLILIAYTLFQNKRALEQNEHALKQNETALNVGNEELKLSRVEFSKSVEALNGQVEQFNFQRFENTFFNMLSLQNEILSALEFSSSNISSCKNIHDESTKSRKVFSSILRWIDDEDDENQTLENYNLFQTSENQIVGHYFRNLFQIIKFIDESGLSDTDVEKYARILRAQLSSDEIAVLFFNCISPKVDNGQFREYVRKYKLLEHLVVEPYLHIDIVKISTLSVAVPSNFLEMYVLRDSNGVVLESAFGTNPALENYRIKKI